MDDQQGIMTHFEKEVHSFVIRIWRENQDNPGAPGEWRGWIQHVQRDKRHYFQEVNDISRIVAGYLNEESGLEDVFEPIRGDTTEHDENEA